MQRAVTAAGAITQTRKPNCDATAFCSTTVCCMPFLHCRTAGSILARLAMFGAADFGSVQCAYIMAIPWRSFLNTHTNRGAPDSGLCPERWLQCSSVRVLCLSLCCVRVFWPNRLLAARSFIGKIAIVSVMGHNRHQHGYAKTIQIAKS